MITPTNIKLDKSKKNLTITFNDKDFKLSAEFLRVYSPSAEVKGHSPEEEILQVDKENVTIKDIQGTGNYAITLFFSDSHDTGIYSWDYLYNLCSNYDKLWNEYLEKLKNANHNHSQIK